MSGFDDLLRPLEPASSEVAAFKRDWDGITPYAMAIVVRTSGLTAAKQGARAIVTATGDLIGFVGGGCVRKAVITAGRAAIAERRPRLIRTVPNDMLGAAAPVEDIEAFASFCPSRGEMDFFIEPVLPPPPLVVFGSGEIARYVLALGPVGNLTALRCAGAGSAATVGTREVAAADLAGLPTLASGFIVVATQGAGDRAALQAALATPCPHILFVASRAKAKNLRTKLAELGFGATDLDRLSSPAGLNIGALEPGEVAISILAEIIQRRRGRRPEPPVRAVIDHGAA